MTISKRLTVYLHGQTEADLQPALDEALRRYRLGHVVGSHQNETSRFRFEVDDIRLEQIEGMTLEEVSPRVYLAAHAPAQVPDWFEPELPPAPAIMALSKAVEQVCGYSALSDEDRQRLQDWARNSSKAVLDDHLEPFARAATEAWKASDEAHTKGDRDRKMARCIAWAWYWADQMIAASATKPRA